MTESTRLHPRVSLTFNPEENMTKTSFGKECDINEIMSKFTRTGVLSHYASRPPEYGEVPAIEYMDALQCVIDADLSFSELPARIRKQFDNNPAKFLEFAENPKNLAEMRELGLAPPAAAPLSDTNTDKPQKKPASAATPAAKPPEQKDDQPS